jgi:hypothetical protein
MNYHIIPLSTFVENKLSEELSASEEVALARHTVEYFKPLLEKHLHINNTLAARYESLSPEELKAYSINQQALLSIGAQLRSALNVVAQIIKKSAEIGAISATRVDTTQLIAILQQIPDILRDILYKSIRELMEEAEYPTPALREPYTWNIIDNALTQFNETISGLKVPVAVDLPDPKQELREMENTIP